MIKPFAFVLIPFSADFDDIYKLGIKATANELGVIAERVDEQVFSESILERIYRQIEAADIIIADMTGRNSNVFYEVGYAHAKGKPCVLLTQDANDIPFDLKHHRHLIYDGSISTLKSQLSQEISWLIAEASNKRERLFEVVLKSPTGTLVKNEFSATADVELVFDIKNNGKRRSPEIEAVYFYTGENWEFEIDGVKCASTEADRDGYALRHFIKAPVQRLSPGAWVQIKLRGEKRVWSKWTGEELKDSYRLVGTAVLEVATSEGMFLNELNLDVEADEFPF